MSWNNLNFYAWYLNTFSFSSNGISTNEKRKCKTLNMEFFSAYVVKISSRIGEVIRLQNNIDISETPYIL